jgi:hypothetical protein
MSSRSSSFWHPFADMAAVQEHGELVLVRGEGVHVWDEAGTRYLDATASLWYCNVGWGRREIGEAVAKQMELLPAYSTFGDITTRPATELAERVAGTRPRPRLEGLPHEWRVRFDRHGHEDGTPLLAAPRRAGADGPDPPREGLPRHAHGRDLTRRHPPRMRAATGS